MKRTLLIGLDAACWDYMTPLLNQKRLPTIEYLMDKGSFGSLETTIPPLTPVAWASISTGKNPGKHGIYDMLWRRPTSYDFTPVNASSRRGKPFWAYLNEGEIKVGLVNVPYTYPIVPVNGFVIAGFGAPNSARDLSYPESLFSDIKFDSGSYKPMVSREILMNASPEAIMEAEIKHQAQHVKLALDSAKEYAVEVLVINLMLTDHANHKMPRMEQVQEAYIRSDADIDTLIKGFRPENVMLISDHGSNRVKGNFLLNAWLHDQGYLRREKRTQIERSNVLNWLLVQALQHGNGWKGKKEKVFRRLARQALLNLPLRITKHFWLKMEKTIPYAYDHFVFDNQPDFSKTLIFPGSIFSGLLYLNICEREPMGVVNKGEKSRLLSEIAEKLFEIKDLDSGERIFSNIYINSEIYHGHAVEESPDLILDFYNSGWNIQTQYRPMIGDKVFNKYFVKKAKYQDYGWHAHEGIFIVKGQDFEVGNRVSKTLHVLDIPSTLLHLYEVPIPDDYDGRVLTNLLAEEYRERSVNYQSGDRSVSLNQSDGLTQDEAFELEEHLRALGYLE